MKISKLFHWLYAILMLLPAFAIGVTCAYAIFNKNAYQSYSNSNIVKKTSLISSTGNVEEGLQYDVHFEFGIGTTGQASSTYHYSDISINWTDYGAPSNYTYDAFEVYQATNNYFVYLRENGTIVHTFWGGISTFGNTFNFSFVASQNFTQNGKQMLKLYTFTYDKLTIDNVFYYSINKVQQSPLFNWAYDSFLATPITYITGLFGIANDHISVMLMSYWLAISVIWLVFDMVMYVPLLVHRWIDKGVLE